MNNLELTLAPKNGVCLAYLDDYSFVFDTYKINNNKVVTANNDILNLDKITKLHLFNDDKEFRAIFSSSSNKYTINLLTKEEETNINPLYLKEQQICLDDNCKINKKNKIRIVNRFDFDENNCIYLENYRLAGLI